MLTSTPALPRSGFSLAVLVLVLLGSLPAPAATEPPGTPSPKTDNPFLRRVAALHDSGEAQASLEVLRQAEKHPGNSPEVKLWLELMRGVLHHGLSQVQQAEEAFRRALARDITAKLPVPRPAQALKERFEQLRRGAVGMIRLELSSSALLAPERAASKGGPALVSPAQSP